MLHAWPVLAPHAHALLTRLDPQPALEEPGVVTTLTAEDVPGEGDSGANRHDEPLFPDGDHLPFAAGRLGAGRNAGSRAARRRARRGRVSSAAADPHHRGRHRRRELPFRAASASGAGTRRRPSPSSPHQLERRARHRRPGTFLSGDAMRHRAARRNRRHRRRFLHAASQPKRRKSSRACWASRGIR